MTLWTQTGGKGRDLVLVHGWGMNASVWLPLARELEKDFRVTLIELPGHGKSSWNDCTGLESWAEQVLELAPPAAVWLGWSLGGVVMQQAAAMQPQKLRGLVGLATSPCFVQRDGWPCGIAPEVLESFAQELTADTRKTLRRFLALQVQGVADAKNLLLQLRREFDSRPAPRPAALQAGLTILLHSDLRIPLADLDLPLSWILGERDTLVPVSLAGYLPAFQPEMRLLVIEGAAHAPFLSHPSRCIGVLREFVRHV